MKELKFRCWDKKNEEMCEVLSVDLQNQRVGVSCIDRSTIYMNSKQPMTHKLLNSDKVEVMQYTGIHDNTEEEKEIYAGDKINFMYKDIEYVAEVVYEAGMFILRNEYLPNSYIPLFEIVSSDRSYWWVKGEIIGNIYENKDLLNTNTL